MTLAIILIIILALLCVVLDRVGYPEFGSFLRYVAVLLVIWWLGNQLGLH